MDSITTTNNTSCNRTYDINKVSITNQMLLEKVGQGMIALQEALDSAKNRRISKAGLAPLESILLRSGLQVISYTYDINKVSNMVLHRRRLTLT